MTNILIVDDNQQNRYMLQVLLSTNGYKVELATNGSEALEKAHRSPPDLIVSDILMPVMDGFALCRAWKEDARLTKIPFVIYTATYTDPKDEDFALNLGADRFLVKPMEPDKFLAQLKEIIKTFKAGKQANARQPVGEEEYYKEYNAALARKLEDKVLQLEEKNRALELDMAMRKQAEHELQESELNFRNFVNNSPDTIYLLDLIEHTTKYLNRDEFCGYSKSELEAPGSILHALHPDDNENIQINWQEMLHAKDNSVESIEYRLKRKDGEWEWIYQRGIVLARTPDGVPRQLLITLSIITDRKRSEENVQAAQIELQRLLAAADQSRHTLLSILEDRKRMEEMLRKSENQLSQIYNTVSDVLFVLAVEPDDQFRFFSINKRFLEVTGVAVEQVVGKPYQEVIPEPAQALVLEKYKEAIRKKETVQWEEISVYPSGIRYGDVYITPIFGEGGKCIQLIGTVHDITERKQAEEKLAQQAEELRLRNEELVRLYRASGLLLASASMGLEQLAQMIVEFIQKELGHTNCSLVIAKKDSNELVRLAIAGPFAGMVKNRMLTLDGPGLIPQALRTGARLNVGNVRSTPGYLPNWEAARSEMDIPLKIGNDVIGVIDLQSDLPDAFGPDDERLMSIFAEQAALALEHSRLNAQTEAHMQQLLALRTIDIAISTSVDLTLILGILLDQVIRLLGIHAVDILTFNTTTQTFKFTCERGFHSRTLQQTQVKFGQGVAWQVVKKRKIVIIPDIRTEKNGLQRTPDLSNEQFVTYIGIPLLAKGQVKGVMEVFHREPLTPDSAWNAFLEMLAGQAAIAIDNYELFDHLQSSNIDLSMAFDSILEGWAGALELRDKEKEGQTRRVAELATRLAQVMGVRGTELLQVSRGVLLHDIGKMGVPESIVLKPGALTEDEWVIMRKHPQFAYELLAPIAYLRRSLDIPYCHHEKWDGTGYPRGLRGEQIPMAARIFAVLDVWDALLSDRPYRKAWQPEKVHQYIQEQAGLHFDPAVVRAFLDRSFLRE